MLFVMWIAKVSNQLLLILGTVLVSFMRSFYRPCQDNLMPINLLVMVSYTE